MVKVKSEFIPSQNFFPGREIPCSVIVYHYTEGGPIESCVEIFQRHDGVSAHFIVGRDGRIIQMVKLEDRAKHAGISEWNGVENVNDFSVGIEICNWGPLRKAGDEYFCGRPEREQKFIGKNIFQDDKGGFWEIYPDVQIKAVIELTKYIMEKFPQITLDNITGHENVARPIGRKIDPGPAFPWKKIRKEIKKHTKHTTVF